MSQPHSSPSMLEAGRVHAEVKEGVGMVRFGHPKGNSLPAALLTGLAEAIETMGRDPAARVIVLTSEGSGPFCGGASFEEFKAVKDAASGAKFFSGFARVIVAMIRAPKFVVTRVQGKTAGGGVGLVAASDYALAVPGAALKLSELAVGIGPFVVGPVIERKIGLAAFSAMAVDAEWRSAEWALQQGLYAEVLESETALDQRVRAFAARQAGYNPDAVRRLKETFWAGTESWDALLAARAEISGALVLSEYTRRAMGG